MRVLQVHNYYRSEQPSGEDIVVDQERSLLEAAGHTVTQFALHSDDIADFSPAQKALVPGRVVYSLQASKDIAQLLDEQRPDVIHVHNTFPLIGPGPLLQAKKRGIPVVATIHNFRLVCAAATLSRDGRTCTDCVSGNPLPGLIHGCYRHSRVATLPLSASIGIHRTFGTWSNNVGTFIFMSRLAADFLGALNISPAKVRIKPHSVPEAARVRRGPGEFALFLGRLSPEKGAGELIDAWPDGALPLVIVGDGPLRSELQDRSAGKNIHFRGKLPREESMQVLLDARFLINPSPALETFGISVVEAFAHGVPALAGDHAVPGEIITPGSTGATYSVAGGSGLAEAIELLSDPHESVRMGEAARREYLKRYTPQANLAALEDIYHDLLQRNGEY